MISDIQVGGEILTIDSGSVEKVSANLGAFPVAIPDVTSTALTSDVIHLLK